MRIVEHGRVGREIFPCLNIWLIQGRFKHALCIRTVLNLPLSIPLGFDPLLTTACGIEGTYCLLEHIFDKVMGAEGISTRPQKEKGKSECLLLSLPKTTYVYKKWSVN